MKLAPALSSALSRTPQALNVVLFSQPACEFCTEVREHYLGPLAQARRGNVFVAEAELESPALMSDWADKPTTQGRFAKASGARFAPTVMFFDGSGRSVARPIVGLSRDFFGAYLEQRLSDAHAAIVSQP